jgi:acetyl esterase/lipase
MSDRRPPVPSSISPEAQAYLAAAPPFGEGDAPGYPTDTEGWLAWVAARDAAVGEQIASRLPGDLPLTSEARQIAGVPTFVLRPDHVDEDAPIYLDIHGGALIMGGGEVCEVMARGSSLVRPAITWAVDYRMPPRHPYPAALDDCLAVYRALLEERPPERIAVGGGSAGGNLAAALLLRAKDEGLPMPAALVLLSPEVDLTESGDSFQTNLGIDHILGSLMEVNRLYADGHDLAHPYLSPLFGDLAGFPPTFLQTGTRDLFLSNTVRMHRKLLGAGVDAQLHIWEAMPHGGFGGAPEDMEVLLAAQRFVDRHLPS